MALEKNVLLHHSTRPFFFNTVKIFFFTLTKLYYNSNQISDDRINKVANS